VTRQDRLDDIAAREAKAAGIRERFGLTGSNDAADKVNDWMLGEGAIPVALGIVALGIAAIVFVVMSLL
jgi:hypothetical protein